MTLRVTEINLNPNTLIAQHSGRIDYCDVFQAKRNISGPIPLAHECFIDFFEASTPFFRTLVRVREWIAKILGLKTDPAGPDAEATMFAGFTGQPGESAGIFKVIARTETELLTGQTDKHLDFLLSTISYQEAGRWVVEVATVVEIHNLLGKVYFFFVKPIHRFYVQRILHRMMANRQA